MGLFKRGDSPYYWYRYQNPFTLEWKDFSTKQVDKKMAEIVADEKKNLLIKNHIIGKVETELLFPLVDKYLESIKKQASYSHKVHYFDFFKKFFGNVPITDITRQRIRDCEAHLDTSVQFSTVNRYLSSFRRFFNALIEDEAEKEKPAVISNPVKARKFMREDELAVERYLEEDEKGKLYSCVSPKTRDMIIVAVKTGIRWGEQFGEFGLKWNQISFENDTVYLPKTKSKKARHVILHPDAKAALLRQPRYGEYVFSNEDGAPLTRNNRFHKEFEKACEKLKLHGLTWHCLRHTRGKELAQALVPEKLMMEQLGHTSSKTTQRYTHFNDDFKKNIIGQVPSDGRYVSATPKLSLA